MGLQKFKLILKCTSYVSKISIAPWSRFNNWRSNLGQSFLLEEVHYFDNANFTDAYTVAVVKFKEISKMYFLDYLLRFYTLHVYAMLLELHNLRNPVNNRLIKYIIIILLNSYGSLYYNYLFSYCILSLLCIL